MARTNKKSKLKTFGNKITYDKAAKAVYVQLVETIKKGEVDKTKEDNFLVLVDRDKDGKALGIEILGIEL